MIELFPIITADADCRRLLGTKPTRFYPFVNAPQNGSKPYAVWQITNGEPYNQLNCQAAADSYAVQIDVYAQSIDQSRAIAKAIRAALSQDPRNTVTRWAMEDFETDTKLYRVSFDVDFIQPL